MSRGHRPIDRLDATFGALTGAQLSPKQRSKFERYLELLTLWNRTHDLTGLKEPAQIVRGLFCDSLLFLALLPTKRPLEVLDLGSGAGIPGIPLHIADEAIRVTAVEARRKRASFLSTLRREIGLDGVEVIHGRAEAVAEERPDLRGQQDVVVCRAAGSPEELIKISLFFLRPDGLLLASGPPPGAPRRQLPKGAEWRDVAFPALGLVRTFLVATAGG